jgi:PTS system nitrogen regulatory IIA component
MNIDSILVPERTVSGLVASSKKRAIELTAEHIVNSLPHLVLGDVYRGLIEREKLGSTAIGKGVAIPHCRLDACETIVGGLFTLDRALDFGAYDDEAVQVLFVLLVPESENTAHLQTLAMLAEKFDSETYRQSLLTASNDAELFDRAIQTIDAKTMQQ